MIEMDESEYMESDYSDQFLNLVSIFCGPEVRDSLLYRRVGDVRLYNKFTPYVVQERPDPIECSGGRFFDSKTEKSEKDNTPILSLDVLG